MKYLLECIINLVFLYRKYEYIFNVNCFLEINVSFIILWIFFLELWIMIGEDKEKFVIGVIFLSIK